jgi:tetratricopeptide (TPR) repeat protein
VPAPASSAARRCWAIEAIDSAGKTIFHSGFIKPDGALDEGAHVYKTILLDEAGRAITRHQVWVARIKAYDNFIPPGRSDIARYRFRVPKHESTGAFSAVKLRARVNYRRFIQEYTDYVLKRHNAANLKVPVVRMAQTELQLVALDQRGRRKPNRDALTKELSEEQASRWNDYGIGLLEQAQYGQAAQAFRKASALNPGDSYLLINAAIAEMRTERYGPEREQLHKAILLLDQALKLPAPKVDLTHARARFFRALVLRGMGQVQAAADELAKIAREYPSDREVQRQLGQSLYALGRSPEARTAFEAVLTVDPNDHGAYQYLAPIYAAENRIAAAETARSLYLLWRDDPMVDPVAANFYRANPQWVEERVTSHAHAVNSPLRPTITGHSASPDR